MKKLLQFSLAASSLCMFSCSSSNSNIVKFNLGTWIVGTQNFTGGTPQNISTNQILSSDNKGNSLQIFFASRPTAGGNYKVVSEFKAASNSLAAGEIAYDINMANGDVYVSSGADNKTAVVQAQTAGSASTNLNIVIPVTEVQHFTSSGTAIDSTSASASITEYTP